jgi:hypothetical protein
MKRVAAHLTLNKDVFQEALRKKSYARRRGDLRWRMRGRPTGSPSLDRLDS